LNLATKAQRTESAPSERRLSDVPALDGIRAFAFMAVIG
jgi:hypothetical protein